MTAFGGRWKVLPDKKVNIAKTFPWPLSSIRIPFSHRTMETLRRIVFPTSEGLGNVIIFKRQLNYPEKVLIRQTNNFASLQQILNSVVNLVHSNQS